MNQTNGEKASGAAGAAACGAGVGYGLVAASGLTAIGVVGNGAGIGAAAGPVGAVVGALVGLAVWGVVKAFA